MSGYYDDARCFGCDGRLLPGKIMPGKLCPACHDGERLDDLVEVPAAALPDLLRRASAEGNAEFLRLLGLEAARRSSSAGSQPIGGT